MAGTLVVNRDWPVRLEETECPVMVAMLRLHLSTDDLAARLRAVLVVAGPRRVGSAPIPGTAIPALRVDRRLVATSVLALREDNDARSGGASDHLHEVEAAHVRRQVVTHLIRVVGRDLLAELVRRGCAAAAALARTRG